MKILITGARSPYTLELARLFHRAGYEVHVADSNFQRITLLSFSFWYKKYHVMKSMPNRKPFEQFCNELIALCIREKIDLLVPTCEETFWVSRHKENIEKTVKQVNPNFEVFTESLDTLTVLHNKWLFNQHVTTPT